MAKTSTTMRMIFLSWIFLLSSCHTDKITTPQPDIVVGIMPLNDSLAELSQYLAKEIHTFYNVKTVILNQEKLPKSAFNPNRNRYRADSLLKFLSSNKPDSVNFIVGITSNDIAATVKSHNDWGVFGLGYCPGSANVISTFRIKRDKQYSKLKSRIKNVSLHELGHNFGLYHCADSNCLMKDAQGKLSSIEGKNRSLCPHCKTVINMP